MKTYNFDEIIDRRGTDCVKYDMLEAYFGKADALPLWENCVAYYGPQENVEPDWYATARERVSR